MSEHTVCPPISEREMDLLTDLCFAPRYQLTAEFVPQDAVLVVSTKSPDHPIVTDTVQEIARLMHLRKFDSDSGASYIISRNPIDVMQRAGLDVSYQNVLILLVPTHEQGRSRLLMRQHLPHATVVCRGLPVQDSGLDLVRHMSTHGWRNNEACRNEVWIEVCMIVRLLRQGHVQRVEGMKSLLLQIDAMARRLPQEVDMLAEM